MGFSIQLLDERGGIQEEIVDEQDRLPHLVHSVPEFESTHCLQYMNPYGDTVFNTLQMSRFLKEWTMVKAQAATPEEKEIVQEVRRLAVLCEKANHLYLKFWGD
ncbi:MAG: hypothetical protein ABSG51_09605 [Terracidiphilus sp.]